MQIFSSSAQLGVEENNITRHMLLYFITHTRWIYTTHMMDVGTCARTRRKKMWLLFHQEYSLF